jgi:2-oxoglutarate dehydrogenase dihydrolipoamide succinyltransferase (E2 component)
MRTKVIMPQLGESVNEGTISKWLKAEGDYVNEFDPLLEINTDKVDTEIPSPTSGYLVKILAPEGTTVQVGNELAWIGDESDDKEDSKTKHDVKISSKPTSISDQKTDDKTDEVCNQAGQTEGQELEKLSPEQKRDLGFISPVVARIASEHQVDLTKVKGSGVSGRITKKDILDYLEQSQEEMGEDKPPKPAIETTEQKTLKDLSFSIETEHKAYPGEILQLTPVRRAIADHMVLSKHTSPHVTTVMEADLSSVISHRQAYKDDYARQGIKLTFTPYFAAATVKSLKAFPIVNSSWSEEGIVIHSEINLGIATSLGEEGLIVPVIKNADRLSLIGLARSINDLASKARSRKLNPDEVKAGTFTITNHGISGSLFASPIINQPQCGILGVGVIQKRVVVIEENNKGDSIAIRPMVYISLTFDHRILDGAIADYFLAKLVESLENWNIE